MLQEALRNAPSFIHSEYGGMDQLKEQAMTFEREVNSMKGTTPESLKKRGHLKRRYESDGDINLGNDACRTVKRPRGIESTT